MSEIIISNSVPKVYTIIHSHVNVKDKPDRLTTFSASHEMPGAHHGGVGR